MAHVVKLRVKDTTASTGTGAKVLARSTLLNFRTFDAVMANGDTCDAIVVNRSANQWEHSSWTIAGVGGEPVLTRLEFKESSTGTPVHFTEGVKDVLMLYPVAGKLDFTARTLKLAPNIIDGTPGTASAFRFYDDGNGWIAGIGISAGSVDIRSGWNLNLWSGQTGNQRNTVRINQNGLSVAAGADVAAGIDPQAVLHVVNRGGAPSAIITTGTNTAVRIGPNGVTSAIEGVDYTGLAAWRPLFVNGEEVLIGTGGVERMRVKWDGAVSIGTTVAGAKFHVQGAGFNGGNGYFVSTDSANSVAIKGTNGAAIFDSAYVALMDGTRTIYLGLTGTAAGGDVGRFRIIGANGQENFSIGTTGNVALGPITAAAKLSLGLDGTGDPNNYGQAIQITRGPSGGQQVAFIRSGAQVVSLGYVPGSNAFGFGLGNTTDASFWPNYLAIGASGNIGIGTYTPNARLSFGTTIGLNGLYLYDDGNAGATGFGISANTLNIFANALSTTHAAIAFGKYDKTTFTEWARIVNGLVGIGIVPSGGRLEIAQAGARGNDAIRLYASGTRKFVFAQFDATNDIGRIGAYDMDGPAGKNLYFDVAALGVGYGHSNPIFGVSIKVGDPNIFLAAGATKGVRVTTNSTESAIEGVDASGVGSFQPLIVKGSTLSLASLSGSKLLITDAGVGIGGSPASDNKFEVHGNPVLKVLFKNWGTAGSASEFWQDVSGRSVYRGVNYDGQYLHEYGAGVATRYSDFANHLFRVPGSGDRLIINTTGVGIGMTPAAILSVMSPTVTTGFATLADFHMPNAVGGATHTRFSIMQLGVSHIGLEVANQANAKGYLGLQPYGGLVTVGPYLNTGDQFSVQADYDGHLNSTIYNHSIGNSAAAKFNMTVRDRHVSRMLYYKDQWMQEKGIGVTQFYSEFDWHSWRNNAGVDKMTLNVNCHLWLANTTDPGVPGTGGYIYISGGALKYRGSGGIITTLAPA